MSRTFTVDEFRDGVWLFLNINGAAHLTPLKQFWMIAHFAKLHDEIHEATAWGLCWWVRDSWLKKVLDWDLVLDALIQVALASGQWAVDQDFNLKHKGNTWYNMMQSYFIFLYFSPSTSQWLCIWWRCRRVPGFILFEYHVTYLWNKSKNSKLLSWMSIRHSVMLPWRFTSPSAHIATVLGKILGSDFIIVHWE